jgi:hypothetical protein
MGSRFATFVCSGAILVCGGWMFAQTPSPLAIEGEPKPKLAENSRPADNLDQIMKERGYATIPLERTGAGYVVVVVSIAEKKIRLILDTGACGTCLDLERTKGLNLEWDQLPGSEAFKGFPEWKMSKKCKIEIMDLNGFKAHGVEANVYNVASVNRALEAFNDRSVDGVLGEDVLRDYSAVIDVRGLRLYLKARR